MRTLIIATVILLGCGVDHGDAVYIDIPDATFASLSGVLVAPIPFYGDASVIRIDAVVSCRGASHVILCAWEAIPGEPDQVLEECSQVAMCDTGIPIGMSLDTTFGITAAHSMSAVIDGLGAPGLVALSAGADLSLRHHTVTE
jgi:hypothetical protein